MRKIITLSILLFCFSISFAQTSTNTTVTWLNPTKDTAKNMYAAFTVGCYINGKIYAGGFQGKDVYEGKSGTTGGDTGVVAISYDKGKTWEEQFILDQKSSVEGANNNVLVDIQFTDSLTGYVLGQNITIMERPAVNVETTTNNLFKTTDGGKTWKLVNNFFQREPFRSFYFKNNTEGYLLDNINYTNDGGITWQSEDSTSVFEQILFTDSNNGYLLGNKIYRTTDAGTSWQQKTMPIPANDWDAEANTLFFVNNNTGFFIDDTAIYKTNNGATSWKMMYSSSKISFQNVAFQDSLNGFAIAIDQNGNSTSIILETSDGGNNWTNISYGIQTSLTFIMYTDSNFYVVGGYGGTLLGITKGNNASATTAVVTPVSNAANTVTIYPNPGRGIFNVRVAENIEGTMSIYNTFGQELKTVAINGQESAFDLSNNPSGVYYVTISSATVKNTHKIIVE